MKATRLALLLCLCGCASSQGYSVKRDFRADTLSLNCVRTVLGGSAGGVPVEEQQVTSGNQFWFGRESLSISRKPGSSRVRLDGIGFPVEGETAAETEQRRTRMEGTLAEIEQRCSVYP